MAAGMNKNESSYFHRLVFAPHFHGNFVLCFIEKRSSDRGENSFHGASYFDLDIRELCHLPGISCSGKGEPQRRRSA